MRKNNVSEYKFMQAWAIRLLILIVIQLIPYSILYSQSRYLDIDVTKIQSKRKVLIIDSVKIDGEKLFEKDSLYNRFIVPDKLLSENTDSFLFVSIYINGKLFFKEKINKKNFISCSRGHKISFFSKKNKIYYIVSDCTSLREVGIIKIRRNEL